MAHQMTHYTKNFRINNLKWMKISPNYCQSPVVIIWCCHLTTYFGVMSLRCLFFHCSPHGLDRCVEIHLTFLSSVRGEAVRLYHVWHEVYPTLPTGEAQSHSHRYVAHFLKLWSCFPWRPIVLPSCCMRSISLVTWLLQTQTWVAFCRCDAKC